MISDTAVIDLLKDENTLLDSRLVGVSVTQVREENPIVELRFRARPGSEFSQITITFSDVIAYEISYDESEREVDVWELKLLQLEDNSFYISLDPDPATLPAAGTKNVQASGTDLFFVRARRVAALVTKIATAGGT